jgi:RNA polymerase sigma-70 factor (ECF subfamily)
MSAKTSDSDPEEAEWVAHAARGDGRAFERLYRRHAGQVYGLCLRMTADPAAAADAAQNAFVSAWQGLADFRGASRFGTWLHRIAVNEVLQSRRRWREEAVADAASLIEGTSDAAGGELDLERAVLGLPERARQVFALHAIYGYSHAEVGEMLGIVEGTSKAQYHRARQLLMDALGAAGPPLGRKSL